VARVAELPDGRFHVDIPIAGHELHFSFSKDLVSQSPFAALWWILAAAIVVTLATAWLLARRVTAPVARLADAARQIGAGEHPAHLPEAGDLELAELARAFNNTATQLAAQRENQATLLAACRTTCAARSRACAWHWGSSARSALRPSWRKWTRTSPRWTRSSRAARARPGA